MKWYHSKLKIIYITDSIIFIDAGSRKELNETNYKYQIIVIGYELGNYYVYLKTIIIYKYFPLSITYNDSKK